MNRLLAFGLFVVTMPMGRREIDPQRAQLLIHPPLPPRPPPFSGASLVR